MHKWINDSTVKPIEITDRDDDSVTLYPADRAGGWDTPHLTMTTRHGAVACVRLDDADRRALIVALGGSVPDA
jgi:hypothetical protein